MSREAAVAATPEPKPQPETAQERATPLRQHPVAIGDGDGGSGSGGGCAGTVVGGWSPRQWPASPRWTRRAAAPTAITRSPTWRGTDAEAQRILDSISSSSSSSSSDDNDDNEQESGGHPGSLSALVSELLVGHPSRSSPVQRSPVRVRVRARRLGGSAGGEEGMRMGAAPPEAWMYARARGARRKQSPQQQQQPPPPPQQQQQQQRQPQQRRQQQRRQQQLLQQWQRQEEEERARHVVARVEGAGLTVASADTRTSPIVRPRVRARRVSGPRTHSGSSPDTARSRSPTTRQNEAAVEIFVESECAQRSF
eukprot:COSAG01_NODE_107_length_25964_cov_174.577576_20_plen_310_part_00